MTLEQNLSNLDRYLSKVDISLREIDSFEKNFKDDLLFESMNEANDKNIDNETANKDNKTNSINENRNPTFEEIIETAQKSSNENLESSVDIENLSDENIKKLIQVTDDSIQKLDDLIYFSKVQVDVSNKSFSKFNKMISKELSYKKIQGLLADKEKSIFCICKASVDDTTADIVACDSGFCSVVWFHKNCVNYDDSEKNWMCFECKRKIKSENSKF